MKTISFLSVATLSAILVAYSQSPANAAENDTASAPVAAPAKKPALSTGLDEIVKLSKAGIDDSVILVYVRNSTIAYTPTAQDLIQLREEGVSPTVTAALMQRGDEIKKAAAETWKQTQSVAAAQPQPTAAPQPQPQPQAQQPIIVSGPTYYTPPVSTVTVIGYPRTYYYNYPVDYFRYNSCYPSYYYPRSYGYYSSPRVSFGVNLGGVFLGGHHGGHHSGFRGGIAIHHR